LLVTKNGKPRTVPLSTVAIEVFREILAAREKKPLEGLEAESNRVFPISYRVVDQAWSRAVKRAKLKDFRFHDLRHQAITSMAKKIPDLQQRLWHCKTGPSTTQMRQYFIFYLGRPVNGKLAGGSFNNWQNILTKGAPF
jgi:integrase